MRHRQTKGAATNEPALRARVASPLLYLLGVMKVLAYVYSPVREKAQRIPPSATHHTMMRFAPSDIAILKDLLRSPHPTLFV